MPSGTTLPQSRCWPEHHRHLGTCCRCDSLLSHRETPPLPLFGTKSKPRRISAAHRCRNMTCLPIVASPPSPDVDPAPLSCTSDALLVDLPSRHSRIHTSLQ